jgi:hypothetical protein
MAFVDAGRLGGRGGGRGAAVTVAEGSAWDGHV